MPVFIACATVLAISSFHLIGAFTALPGGVSTALWVSLFSTGKR